MTKGLFDAMNAYNGNEPGDPEKAVGRIVDVVKQEGIVEGRGIPSKQILGADGLAGVRKKCEDTLDLLRK